MDMAAVSRGLSKFISLIPANGVGIITVPFIKDLKRSALEKHLVDCQLGALTKGARQIVLGNGARMHLAAVNANTLREADIILAIWPTHLDLPDLETWNRWQTIVVVGFTPSDWLDWEAMHKPVLLS